MNKKINILVILGIASVLISITALAVSLGINPSVNYNKSSAYGGRGSSDTPASPGPLGGPNVPSDNACSSICAIRARYQQNCVGGSDNIQNNIYCKLDRASLKAEKAENPNNPCSCGLGGYKN